MFNVLHVVTHRIFGSIFTHNRIPASPKSRSHGKRWSLLARHTSLLVSSFDNPSQVNVSATTAPRRPRFAEQPHGPFVSVKTHTSSRSSGHYMRDDLLSTTIVRVPMLSASRTARARSFYTHERTRTTKSTVVEHSYHKSIGGGCRRSWRRASRLGQPLSLLIC